MFGKFTYLSYTLIFTLPLMVVIWVYYWHILKKFIKLIFFLVLILTFYGSIMMTAGLANKSWSYDPHKFLGIFILGAVLDDIIWWACILSLEISVIIVLLTKKEKKEPILKREKIVLRI